jgi:RNA polymerase sigma-70 factor, ECF subfamily
MWHSSQTYRRDLRNSRRPVVWVAGKSVLADKTGYFATNRLQYCCVRAAGGGDGGPVMNVHIADDELIARVAGSDSLALETLYTRHQSRIFRLIKRIVRNEAVAEELTNEVFVDVWRHACSYEHRSLATTWLLSIAHNRAVSALRKRREEQWDEDEAAELQDETDTSDVVMQKAEKGRMLRKCIEALPFDQREILDLVYYHELSVSEAGTVLNIPQGTVKTRLFTARKRLSELLKKAGVDRGWP